MGMPVFEWTGNAVSTLPASSCSSRHWETLERWEVKRRWEQKPLWEGAAMLLPASSEIMPAPSGLSDFCLAYSDLAPYLKQSTCFTCWADASPWEGQHRGTRPSLVPQTSTKVVSPWRCAPIPTPYGYSKSSFLKVLRSHQCHRDPHFAAISWSWGLMKNDTLVVLTGLISSLYIYGTCHSLCAF